MDLKAIEEIINLLKQNDITEFELEKDGLHIRLTRAARVTSHGGNHQWVPSIEPAILGSTGNHISQDSNSANSQAANSQTAHNFVKVESPIVGTFYRKPSPEAETFTNEGDIVKKGDTLCIVEAMKVMNEIESPCDGKVEKILLNDGHVVEFGEVLFLINSNA